MADIRLACDREATADELAAVEEAFRRAGLEIRAEATVGRKSAGPVQWVIYVTLATPVAAFFQSFGSEAGKDAYGVVKRWVKDVWAARRGNGSMVLEDSEHSTLVLSTGIPEDALDALRDLDWSENRGAYLVWSERRGEWLDPMRSPSGF